MKPKKLGTPKGGDLMRKLIYGLYPVRIVADVCSATDGLEVSITLIQHMIGKIAAECIDGIVKYGECVTVEAAARLAQSGVKTFRVFSPVACRAENGVCARCYGWDLSTHKKPEVGLPVGILAAQSIGERATQDFMKVFHGFETELLRKVSDAKSLMESGRLPEHVSENPTPSALLSWLDEAYDGKVNTRHFEVVLRQMKTEKGWSGLAGAVQKWRKASPLAAASFRSPVSVLVDAAEKSAIDSLNIDPGLIFVGDSESGISHDL